MGKRTRRASTAPLTTMEGTRWSAERTGGASSYDDRWTQLAAQGQSIHGEADFVESLGATGRAVLDAGCGTGRIAIELARRGFDVVGVDLDRSMLDQARAKAPELEWVGADLATLALGRRFDIAVLAGNVMIFLRPGTEAVVVARIAAHLVPGGRLVAGFQLQPGGYDLAAYDRHAEAAGLRLTERWGTWDRDPYVDSGDYAVSVHTRAGSFS